MRFRDWLRGRYGIERRLRLQRPTPPPELVDRLVAKLAPPRPWPARLARAGVGAVASAAILVAALGAVGGVGNGASLTADYLRVAWDTAFFGERMAPRRELRNAAVDQYGNPVPEDPPPPTTTTTAPPTSPPQEDPPPGEVSQPAEPGTANEITVTRAGTTQTTTVRWGAATFSQPVVVIVDTTPELTNTALVGSGNQLVSVTVRARASGEAVTRLAAPIEIIFQNPPAGFVPVISSDGISFRALIRIAGPELPADLADGYYVDARGSVHILTLHPTILAVLYRANVTTSESGRRTKQPGSGLFGDPTRIHAGPAALRQVRGPVTPRRLGGKGAYEVPFAFFIDEQAVVTVSVFRGERQLLLSMKGTRVRGHALTGVPRKSIKVLVRRPGTVTFRVRVAGRLLEPGMYRIRVWAVDYDGNRTIRFIPFRVE